MRPVLFFLTLLLVALNSGCKDDEIGVCEARCEVEAECSGSGSVDDCTDACKDQLTTARQFSPACGTARRHLEECLGGLSCGQYTEYISPSAYPYPCVDEDDEITEGCDGQ
jgi:hypothetical protein